MAAFGQNHLKAILLLRPSSVAQALKIALGIGAAAIIKLAVPPAAIKAAFMCAVSRALAALRNMQPGKVESSSVQVCLMLWTHIPSLSCPWTSRCLMDACVQTDSLHGAADQPPGSPQI